MFFTSSAPVPTVAWCKSKCPNVGCDGGSNGTYVKRAFALTVATRMAGSESCLCGAPISLWDGEVDRTVAGCYKPGSVILTCHACNNDRTHVAFDTARYARDVLAASEGVEILRGSVAKRLWLSEREIGKTLRNHPYYLG